MNKNLTAVIFCLLCAVCEAQKSTELYIPIGKSPGLSIAGKTITGTVTKVDGDTITVGAHTIRITADTKIFLDRSQAKLTNLYGAKQDIKVGVFVEGYLSEWLKIRSN